MVADLPKPPGLSIYETSCPLAIFIAKFFSHDALF